MVGTNVGFPIPLKVFADACATMPTDVVHGFDIAVFSADNNDRVLTNLDELVVADLGNLTAVQRINPAFENEML